MHKRTTLPVIVFLGLFFVLASFAHGALVGKVSSTEGRADVLKVGTKALTPVKTGTTVDIGDIFRVKSDGKVEITFFDGGIIRIGPASRVEIKDYSSDSTKTNNVIRLATGHVQVITGKTFIQKVSQFTEGNKFEVHTPNATAGVRGSNMVVSFIRSVTTTLFIDGKGYQYNPADPSGTRVTIVKGEISFVHAPLAPPTPPRKASPIETTQIVKTVTVTPPGQPGGTGPGSGGTTPPSGTGTTGGTTTSSSGTGTTTTSGTTSGPDGTSGTTGTATGTSTTTQGGYTTVSVGSAGGVGITTPESPFAVMSTPLAQTTSPTSTTIGQNTIAGVQVTTLPTIPITEVALTPLLVIITGVPEVTASTSATFSVTASEASTFSYSLDGGSSFIPFTGSTVTVSGLAEGNRTLIVRATDTYGRTATGSASWTIDLTSPVVSILTKPALLTNSSAAAFGFSATDATAVTYQYSMDGGSTWASAGSSLSLAGLAEGAHSLSVRGIDAAGNVSATQTYSWTTDYTGPVAVTVAGVPTGSTKLNTATVTLAGMDAGASYSYSTDGGATWTPTAGTITLAGLPEGKQDLTVRGVDAAGNVTAQTYSWITDYTAPVIGTFTKSSAPTAGATANLTVNTTTGEATDTAYAIDAGGYTTVTGTSFTANVSAGSHTLSFKAIDAAGNVSQPSDIMFTLNRYSLLGNTYGTGSVLSGSATGDVAEIPTQPWGSWLISMTGAYTGPSSSSWQTTSGGTMTDLSSANTGYWLSQGTGTYAGNVMTGSSSFSYITGTTLGGGTGIITGSHGATTYTLSDSGSNLTANPLTAVNAVNTTRYSLQNTGTLTAGAAVAAGSQPRSVAVDPTGKFAYVANRLASTISVYTINQTTGALTAGTAVATGVQPDSVAVDPTGRFAYVANMSSYTVSVYTINQTTGALTAGTAAATGTDPNSVAVDPTGRFAYVANYGSNTVSVYTINQTTGALTAGTAVAAGANPYSVAVDPTGKFAYVANASSNTVSVYTINQTTGALTAGTAAATGSGPVCVTVDPTGRFVYVGNWNSKTVSVYTINPITGALTAGTAAATTSDPRSVAVDPTGKFVYVANSSSDTVAVYTIDQATGALTAAGSIGAGLNPFSIAVDPTGRFVYVANQASGNVSVYSIAALTRTADGTMTAYLGTTASLWTATSGSPATVTAIGTHGGTTTAQRTFTTNVGSYNYTAGNTTTYDGGAYKGYMAGISNNAGLAAQMVALYIDPSGNAGYLTGNLSGTAYPDIFMFQMSGGAYTTQVAAAIGIAPANLDTAATEQTGSVATSGTIGTGGRFNDIYTTGKSFKTLSIADGTTALPWGIYSLMTYGTFLTPSSGTSVTANLGGGNTPFGKYYDGTALQPDTGYWRGSMTGTWSGNIITATLTGTYISKTRLGVLNGGVLGTYDTAWQMTSIGTWLGTPLTAVSDTSATRYTLQNTGLLTAGAAVATGTGPYTAAIDPTGKFAYVANANSNTVSVYTINQTTGALTAGTAVATGSVPYYVAVDPTGKFAYVTNFNSNTVSVYTINQVTGALTAGGTVATGANPYSVAVDPTGKFAYVANESSDTVSVYTINQVTGALMAGTAVATGSVPYYVAVDPTGKFAYVTNRNSNTVSVYTINQITGALMAGTAVATGTTPSSVTVDPTGRFAYVANYGSATVSVYTINQMTGALTAGGTVATGTNPYSVAVDPMGKLAYVANAGSNTVSVYAIDQTTGALTAGGTVATGTNPYSVAVDPMGRFAYVANYGSATVSAYTVAPVTRTADGTMTAYMGTTASLWTATSGAPAPVTAIGTHSGTTTSPHLFTTNVGSYNYTAGNTTTYDGGAYKGYMAGISNGTTLAAKVIALYIDPSGNAGYLTGSLTGTAYADISMFSMTGSAYPTQMAAAIGIAPVNLDAKTYEGTGNISLKGAIDTGMMGTGGTFKDTYSAGKYFKTLSIVNGTDAQPWGIYSFMTYGTFMTPSWGTTFSATLGGGNTPFGEYSNGAAQPDTAYWLGTLSSGTWSGSTITATLAGTYISKTRLGSISGNVIGAYGTAWQMSSLGTWMGTPLKAVNDVSATRYTLQNTGLLTAGPGANTGSSPQSVAIDPTGRFAYVANWNSNDVSVYTVNQATGELTGGTTVAAGTNPYSVAVDPTGKFVYVANGGGNTVSAYTIDQVTGALTAAGTGSATNPFSVAVAPGGKFLYAANYGSASVTWYTINTTTGWLTAGGSLPAEIHPRSVAVDPTGRFVYVANETSNSVSVYMINPMTGALTAGMSTATGTAPYSVAVDPTGRFAYVANFTSNTVSVYTINSAGGALTPVTTVSTGANPRSVTIDPTGKFVYVASEGSNNISIYVIDQGTGALTAVSIMALTGSGSSVAIDPTGRFAYCTQTGDLAAVFSVAPVTRTADGTMAAYMGTTATLWTATQAAPAGITVIGTTGGTTTSPHTFTTNIGSYNHTAGNTTTYDGGAYKGFLTGITSGTAMAAKLIALYIDAAGNAGYLAGNLTGTTYPDISMFQMSGGAYPTQVVAALGIAPVDLDAKTYEGTGSISLSGTIGIGGTLKDTYSAGKYFKTLSIADGTTAQPWGIYSFLTYGTFMTPSTGMMLSATAGGGNTPFGKYFDGAATQPDTGYWLANMTGGVWSGDTVTTTLTGTYISKTRLGSISGNVLGTRDTAWQISSLGTWQGTPLTAVNDVSATRYGLQNTGLLTAGTDVAAGSTPRSVTIDPTGRFAYVPNQNSNTVSVYTINQLTGELTAGTAVAAGSQPTRVAVDPTGRFAYVTNLNSNTVSIYTIDHLTGALTAGDTVAAGGGPRNVIVDPTGRFAYVTNNGGNTVSVYTINQVTGALTAGTAVAAGTTPWGIIVDPTGRFAYVTNYNSADVSVYTIDQVTGALTAGTAVAAGSGPYTITVDRAGRFAYVANGNSNTVSVYTIDQVTGALTAGTAVAAGTMPVAVTVDPTGRFAYVTNNTSNTISVYAIDQTTGALTALTTIAAGTTPSGIIVDRTGRFTYVANQGSNTVSLFTIDPVIQTADGSIAAYTGTTASLWTATSGTPATLTAIGTQSGTTTSARLFTTNVASYNYTAGNTTTYDGGAYKGYLTGITSGTNMAAKMVALYIDPLGNAGYLTGNLSGTAYAGISMFSMTGGAYPTQMATAAEVGIAPVDLTGKTFEGVGNIVTAGTIGTGGWFRDTYSAGKYFKTLSIVDGTNAQPWGVYSLMTYGTFMTPSSGSTMTAVLGGASTPFGKYSNGAGMQPDTGYWLADLGSGTWSGNTITATLAGTYISKTRLGTLSGNLLGTYDTAWQTASVGSWQGTPLAAVSDVNATRYNLQTTGSLTAGAAVAAVNAPFSVAVDPTGKFAYVANYGSSTVSMYTINQTTGALTAGTAVATGTNPLDITVDPTGRFAYVANNTSNTVSMYTVNQTTGALTAGTTVATGTSPQSVAVDPTGRFAYVANYGSSTVSMYTINQTTGALTAGTTVATGNGPSTVAVDPTGKFAYVTNREADTVSVYTINQTTGALTAGTTVATGIYPLGITVDPTGRFVYVTNNSSNTVSMYTINQTTGALTAGTTVATGDIPRAVAVDPTGRFAYVTNEMSNTVSMYTINQTTGALTAGTTVATGDMPFLVAVDPTGRFAYVTNYSSATVSVYSIDAQTRTSDGTLTAYIGSTSSLFSGGTTPVTMIGTYSPTTPASFIWGQAMNSYNFRTSLNTTYDSPANAYAGYLAGYKANDNTAKAKWASIYVKDDGSAGLIIGSLSGNAYPGISMLKLDGTLNAPVEIVSSAIGFTPDNLLSNINTRSYVNGTPLLNTGAFGGGGTLLTSYYERERMMINGQGWGVFKAVGSGTYAGTTSNDWSLSFEHFYSPLKSINGTEMAGTVWTGNKLEGTLRGYVADWSGTGTAWVNIGDVIGTYDPNTLTFQVTAAGTTFHVDKFLAMTVTEATKLQALNIPCVQVGNVNLTGSTNYGAGTVNVAMNNTRFFATNAGGPAQLWATGTSQMGNWTGTAPASNTTVAISGGGLNANFNFKAFDAVANKWGATITNGAGGFNGSTTFRGAAAGTVNVGAGTFSGAAAGVAK